MLLFVLYFCFFSFVFFVVFVLEAGQFIPHTYLVKGRMFASQLILRRAKPPNIKSLVYRQVTSMQHAAMLFNLLDDPCTLDESSHGVLEGYDIQSHFLLLG